MSRPATAKELASKAIPPQKLSRIGKEPIRYIFGGDDQATDVVVVGTTAYPFSEFRAAAEAAGCRLYDLEKLGIFSSHEGG